MTAVLNRTGAVALGYTPEQPQAMGFGGDRPSAGARGTSPSGQTPSVVLSYVKTLRNRVVHVLRRRHADDHSSTR